MAKKRQANMAGGVARPTVTTGPADPVRARVARKAMTAGGVGRAREAGMLIDVMQPAAPYVAGYKMNTYRNSYAYGLGDRTGSYDIPTYFVQMNEQNGGMLYWPVTLSEKYSWYRYWARCIYLNDNNLGQVLMADGTTKSVKDIQIGEEVVTGKGTIRKVKDKFERRFADDNAVTLKAWCLQNQMKTTHHHPYWILRGDSVKRHSTSGYRDSIEFKPEWVHAEDVRPGDYVLMAPYVPEKFSDVSVEQASFLGYYASEGSVAWGLRCVGTDGDDGEKKASGWKWHQDKVKVPIAVSFTLHKDEEMTVGRSILELALSVFGVEGKVVRRRENHIELSISGRNVGEFCHLHVGCGSVDKKLSRDLLDATVDAKKAFLLAYAEGDGYQYLDDKNNGKIIIGTASEALESQVQMMAISAGVMCRTARYDRAAGSGFKSETQQIHITIPSWSADSLVAGSSKWIESDSDGDRHCALFVNGYAAFKVKDVTFSQEDDVVYNIEVDAEGDEKSFICNGMVTHNTDAYVGRGLELLADLPMSKLTLNMPKMKDSKKQKEILEFFEYQMEVLNMFEHCQSILWELNMIGNCFPADHLVHTDNGMVPICQIRRGDKVLMANGKYGDVSDITRRHVSEWLVDFDINRLSAVEFTPTSEHPVVVLRNNSELMVKAEEIRVGDYVGVACHDGVVDVESMSVVDEIKDILVGRYDKVEVVLGAEDVTVSVEYDTPSGASFRTSEIKDKISAWMGKLEQPVDMTCESLSVELGISDVSKLRSVSYLMRKRGIIHTERIGAGRHGSSIRWFPLRDVANWSECYGRTFKKDFTSKIKTLDVDEDFLYLLGYWLGDGWLWEYKRPTSYPYLAFDICAQKDTPQCERLLDVMSSVFGEGNFCHGSSPVFDDESLFHVSIEDPVLCAWWGHHFGSNCENKKLPRWIMDLPPEKQMWILRGMIDSDGYVSVGESADVGLVNTNLGLMHQLFQIGIRCGIPFCFSKQASRVSVLPNGLGGIKNAKPSFVLKTTDNVVARNLISGCVKCVPVPDGDNSDCGSSYRMHDGRFYFRVANTGCKFYDGFVYNFEVEGDHTYCVNHIRVHNCFIFVEYDEKKKMWSRAVMLPPEETYVFQYPFSDEKRVEYRPLRLIGMIKAGVMSDPVAAPQSDCDRSGMTEKILEGIPKELVKMVEKEGCIVMDSDPMTGSFVHHIARRRSPYEDLGASVLERVLVPMLQKEHYRYTQLSLASRNMTPKNLITAEGLMPDELDDLRAQVDLSYMDPEYSVITNYNVEWNQIGMQERFLDFSREYETIENQVFAAMGVTRELLTGEGAYTGTKITVEILNTMFLLTREVLKNYIEKQLFIPLCKRHGWVEKGENGVERYLYPRVGFNRLTIRDNQEVFESLFQLYQKGSLPVDVIYELFNLNSDEMHAKMKKDLFTMKDATFNRMVEEINAETGRAMVHDTDIVEKVAKYLGLKYTPENPKGGEGALGGGLGGGMEDVQGETPAEGQPEGSAGGEQPEAGGEVDDAIVQKALEKLPPDATDEDISKAVDEAAAEDK